MSIYVFACRSYITSSLDQISLREYDFKLGFGQELTSSRLSIVYLVGLHKIYSGGFGSCLSY